jgi:hypothetical protein
MTATIILPWIGFGFAIIWMIRKGDKAKEEYLTRKAQEEETAKAIARADRLQHVGSSDKPDIPRFKDALQGPGQKIGPEAMN